jgi:ketosteroid isomerase-like protein
MMTPKELLSSYVEKFNPRNVSSLMNMYEPDACFVQPTQVVTGIEDIRQNLQSFIDMNGKLETKVTGVIQTSNLALVNIEWSFNGTGPDGNPNKCCRQGCGPFTSTARRHMAHSNRQSMGNESATWPLEFISIVHLFGPAIFLQI